MTPRPLRRQHDATVGFETAPDEQAQVDWATWPTLARTIAGTVSVENQGVSGPLLHGPGPAGRYGRLNPVPRQRFPANGRTTRHSLYDNVKIVTLARNEGQRLVWNRSMLRFALRVGFEIRLCRPYRTQNKGKVESRVQYVRRNTWPSMRFTGDADLKYRELQSCDGGTKARVHRTAPPGTAGDAEREAASLGQAAGTICLGSISARGRKGGPLRSPRK